MRQWSHDAFIAALLVVSAASPVQAGAIRGSWTDTVDDVSQRHIDLFVGGLYAEGPTSDLEISINVAGLHQRGKPVDSMFEMFWNTDNNPKTGLTFGPFHGIEKVLRIHLTGWYPFTDQAGSIKSELVDTGSNGSTPLVAGKVEGIVEIVDYANPPPPGTPSAREVNDAVVQLLPLPLLGPLTDQVPIGVRATDLNTKETDQAVFVLNTAAADPFLRTAPEVGQPEDQIQCSGVRFSPLTAVQLTVDGADVGKTHTQHDGSFAISFAMPSLPAGDHLLAAMDERGHVDLRLLTIRLPSNKNAN